MKTWLFNKHLCRIAFASAIFFISWQSLSPQPIDAFQYASDKVLHFIAWFALGLLLIGSRLKYYVMGFALLFAYSCLIEVFQHFIPGRYFSVLDMLANAAGIVGAVILSLALKAKIKFS